VLTNRYDNARSGTNLDETILTTSNVNKATFGIKFSVAVTGKIYGQPLYVSGLTIGGAAHNVVYVATAHNVVYAFDGDVAGAPLWTRALEPSLHIGSRGLRLGCGDMSGEVGITSTPVISLDENAIYVVVKTSGKHLLHALDLQTGQDKPGSPVAMAPTGFSSNAQLNRPGLLLLDGVVYSAFGSHCDEGHYHGWILGHDAKTLAQTAVYNTTPTGREGAIWQSGTGLASDGTSIWACVGNGSTGGENVSMNVISLLPGATSLTLGPRHMDPVHGDNDLAAGPVIVGDHVLSGGKSGNVILLDRSNAALAQRVSLGGEVHNVAAWNGSAGQMVYAWGEGGPLHAWQLTGGQLVAAGTNSEQKPGHPGGMITISSNGITPGTGVLWALMPRGREGRGGGGANVLYAYDASNVAKPSLWNSDLDPADVISGNAKFSPPTVANGKVYAATFAGKLMVYGLK
jgi:outer membrane protein assembly factor BamB